MDNYKLSLNKIGLDKKEKIVEVDVSYRHKMVTPHIPPKKSIHFMLLVVPLSDYPVILQATETVIRNKRGNKKAFKVVTVTGRLMPLKNNRLQLVPVVIKRGSKNSYYVAEPLPEGMNLHRYIGKVVVLQGTISHERNSPYEADLTVNKLVKVYR